MDKDEEISFFNFSGNSPTDFLDHCFPSEDRVIILATHSSEKKEDLLFCFGVKNLNDSRFQNILSAFERDGYQLSYYFESFEHYSGKSEKEMPLSE